MSTGTTAASAAPATHTLGVPRIGLRRELKRALESCWRGESTEAALAETARRLRLEGWQRQREAGVDLIACNDFSLYDHVLDTACLVGCVPARFDFAEARISTATMFAMARGGPRGGRALEMTKWFDTNYHHLVPEVGHLMPFRLASDKPFEELAEARAAGIAAKPVLLGPVSFLRLAKAAADAPAGFSPLARLEPLLAVYGEVLRRLDRLGAEWVQLDEPILALDLPVEVQVALARAYDQLRAAAPRLKLMVATYFGPLEGNLETFLRLPVAGLHVDAVRGRAELPRLLEAFPRGRTLSLGVVDGRNVWRTDLADAWAQLELARAGVGTAQLMVAPSCSLLHVPWSLRLETGLPEGVRRRLAFAEEKLGEVVTLARALRGEVVGTAIEESRGGGGVAASPLGCTPGRRTGPGPRPPLPTADRGARANNLLGAGGHSRRSAVEEGMGFPGEGVPRLLALAAAGDSSGALARRLPYGARRRLQRERLHLPPWPTTTIGSLPQTDAIRAARARWRAGELDEGAYQATLERETAAGIARQQAVGLDVLIHGEFERTDMVEHFAEQLDGLRHHPARLGAELRLALRAAAHPARPRAPPRAPSPCAGPASPSPSPATRSRGCSRGPPPSSSGASSARTSPRPSPAPRSPPPSARRRSTSSAPASASSRSTSPRCARGYRCGWPSAPPTWPGRWPASASPPEGSPRPPRSTPTCATPSSPTSCPP